MESFLTPYSLSNASQEKLQFTPFWCGPKLVCSDGLGAGTTESHNFFVLSYPGEFSHSNSPNWELSNDLSGVVVLRRKVALHTSSHLTPTEAWWSAVSTTSESRRFSSEVQLENCTQVWGLGQIWTACDSPLRKNSDSHVFWLVQTCRNLSEPVRNTVTMYARRAMSFFVISNALILRSYVLNFWNCIF